MGSSRQKVTFLPSSLNAESKSESVCMMCKCALKCVEMGMDNKQRIRDAEVVDTYAISKYCSFLCWMAWAMPTTISTEPIAMEAMPL